MDSKDIKKYELMDIKTGNTMSVPATQELKQSLLLQHERLKKHGLQVEVREEETEPLSFGGGEIIGPDEVYKSGVFNRELKRTTKYVRINEEVVTFQDDIRQNLFVMDMPGENSRVSSVDVIYERMTYGRDKEYLDRLSFKLMKIGVNLVGSWMVSLWMICGTSGLFVYALFFVRRTIGWAAIAVAICVAAFKGSMSVTRLYGRKWTFYQRRTRSRKVVEEIRKEMPDFCMEKLVALMDGRLNRIIYSENPEELGTFLDCDISTFRKDHENVIHMERTNFWFEKYYKEGDYLHLNIRQRMYMTEYKDNGINREEKEIRMYLTKPIAGIMTEDFYEDWYVSQVEAVKDLVDE